MVAKVTPHSHSRTRSEALRPEQAASGFCHTCLEGRGVRREAPEAPEVLEVPEALEAPEALEVTEALEVLEVLEVPEAWLCLGSAFAS